MKFFKLVIYIFLTAFSTMGCVKEDLSSCKQAVMLKISYQHAKEEHTDEITRLDLYVFDRNGTYVGQYTEDNIIFSDGYIMSVDLAPGRYSFVVWANYNNQDYTIYDYSAGREQPFVKGMSRLEDMRLKINSSGGVVAAKIKDLFYGNVVNAEILDEVGTQTLNAKLIKNTNTIRVKISNPQNAVQGNSRAPSDFTVDITADNEVLDFSNNILHAMGVCQYLPHRSTDDGAMEMTVFRMQSGVNMILRIMDNNGQTLFSENLIEILLRADNGISTDEDLDRISLFDIEISFGVNSQATVVINGWIVKRPNANLE